jgi:20S proteasome alpha/beta subunit
VCKAPKVYKVGPVGVGICGNVRSEQILEKTLKYQIPRRKEKITHKWLTNGLTEAVRKAMKKHGSLRDKDGVHEMKDSAYMLTFNGAIYHFDQDFGLWDSARPYSAIGAGRSIAFGSLAQSVKLGLHNDNPKKAVLDALEIASDWSPWVCGPHTIIEV